MAGYGTGGTPAPSAGKPAGALPKASAPKGALPRYYNKASGHMETAQAMHAYRVPAAARVLGAPKGHTPGHGGGGGSAPAHAPAKSWLEMNPGELQQYATNQVKSNLKSELEPYHQRANELTANERAATERFKGFGEQAQNSLTQIQTGASEQAKTAENVAAEQALRASKAVETSGQNAQTNNAGYISPQLAGALGNQSELVRGIGAAQQANAASQAQNEGNYLTNLRAAATQRINEGQQNIGKRFGAEQQKLGNQEQSLLAKQPGMIQKLATELAQKQFTNRATEQGLGIKLGDLGVARENAASKARSVTAGEQNNAAKNRIAEKKLSIDEVNAATNRSRAESDATYKQATVAEKHAMDESNSRYKRWLETRPGKPSAQTQKTAGQIFTFWGLASSKLGGKPGKTSHAQQEKVRQELLGYEGKPRDAALVSAAMNLSVYGHLGPQDKARLKAAGIDPKAIEG